MINLSKKAADKFKISWSNLSEQSGDNWKVDLIQIGRYPVLLIVHEKTLFTLVRRKAEIKTIDAIAKEIAKCCPWYPFPIELKLGKNSNKRLSGSIVEMRSFAWQMATLDEIDQLEGVINSGLFSYLSDSKYGYGKPINALKSYTQRN